MPDPRQTTPQPRPQTAPERPASPWPAAMRQSRCLLAVVLLAVLPAALPGTSAHAADDPDHLYISIDDAYDVVDVQVSNEVDILAEGTTVAGEAPNPYVRGPETIDLENGTQIKTSSSHLQWDGEGPPEYLLDGDPKTRWSSDYRDGQRLELRFPEPIDGSVLKLNWETAAAADYIVSTSTNGDLWLMLKELKDQKPGPRVDSFDLPDGTRHVRLQLIKRATEWGFSLFDIVVAKRPPPPTGPPPVDAANPAPAPDTTGAAAPDAAAPAPAAAEQVGAVAPH